MTERDIEILEDLSKSKNITKTAENLYTTQSAITKRLQGIEEDCGGTLFLRSKCGLIHPLSKASVLSPRRLMEALAGP